MPDAVGLEIIAGDINARHDGAVIETHHEAGIATLLIDPEQNLDVLRWLRDTRDQTYRFLSSVHGADYFPHSPRFSVHYELLCMDRVERIHVKALLGDPNEGNGHGEQKLPEIDSCVELFPTADFQEREIYDFFGINFRGHPDMRRILMPEDYVGWPQRRDFPMGGEPVIFTFNEGQMPRWYE